MRIAIENHMELRSTELLQIAAQVASPVLGFCFDTGNSLAVLEEPIEAGDFSRIAAQTAKQVIAQRMR